MSQAHPEKHICIYELERKGNYSTEKVVCRICGVYLSSLGEASTQEMAVLRFDKEKSADS